MKTYEEFLKFIEDAKKEGRCFDDGEVNLNEYLSEYLSIPSKLWKQLPDHAVQILEEAGYTEYDRKTDSIVFVEK